MSDEKYYGSVVFFENKLGYGFLQQEHNKELDIFVHFSDIIVPNGGFKTLKKGQRVEYSIGQNNRGEDKAVNVTVVG